MSSDDARPGRKRDFFEYLWVCFNGITDRGTAVSVYSSERETTVLEWLEKTLVSEDGCFEDLSVVCIGPDHLVTGDEVDVYSTTIGDLGTFDTTAGNYVRIDVMHWQRRGTDGADRCLAAKLEVADPELALFKRVATQEWHYATRRGGLESQLAVTQAVREAMCMFDDRLEPTQQLDHVHKALVRRLANVAAHH